MAKDYISGLTEKFISEQLKGIETLERKLRNHTLRYCKMLMKDLKQKGCTGFELPAHPFISVLLGSRGKLGIKIRPNIGIYFDKSPKLKDDQKLVNELKLAFPNASVGRHGGQIYVHQEKPDDLTV